MINNQIARFCMTAYEQNLPWPHMVFDNFFSEDVLKACWREARAHKYWVSDDMSGYQDDERTCQVNKFWYPGGAHSFRQMAATAPTLTTILQYLNSPEMLLFLEPG